MDSFISTISFFSVFLSGFQLKIGPIWRIEFLQRINPFHVTDLFWYPLKTQKTRGFLIFSGGIKRDYYVFRGYQKRSVTWNGLRWHTKLQLCWVHLIFLSASNRNNTNAFSIINCSKKISASFVTTKCPLYKK